MIIPLWTDVDQLPNPFTIEELRRVATRLPSGKSPDPNGMLNEVFSGVVRWNSAPLLKALNVYLKKGSILYCMEDGEGPLPI